ncbi:MAG: hypothetical protein VYC34_12180 [Planctomycetota bacterium]|nr:hypothetical protein [Planctomycetota bacterium]
MEKRIKSRQDRSFPLRRAAAPAALALASASICAAGLVGGGGDAYIWTGAFSDSWHNPANWTIGAVPVAGGSAIVDAGPGNVFLNGDSAMIASLYVGGGRAVSTNGHRLRATSGNGETTLVGLDSRVFVTPVPGNLAGFETDLLEIQNQARLSMSGGRARIYEQIVLNGDARIVGHGSVEVDSGLAVAFNGLNGEYITATGDLAITVTGGGAIALPPVLNVLSAGASLAVNGPFFLPVGDINLGEDAEFSASDAWTLAGDLVANPGANHMSTVSGGSMHVDGLVHVQSGVLEIESPVYFDLGSTIDVDSTATLVLSGSSNAGAQTTIIGPGGRLRIDGEQPLGPAWNGDIELTGAAIEYNGTNGPWRFAGDLEFNSLLTFPSRLQGTTEVRATGNVFVNDAGAVIEGALDLRPTSSTELELASTRIIVEGSLRQRAGAEIFGPGSIDIADSGIMTVYEPVDLDVDVQNAGAFNVAQSNSPVGYAYINADYVQTGTGCLDVQIAGPGSMERDIYETSGMATFAGEIMVSLLDGYMPMPGDTFEVFFANGGIVGEFDIVAGEPGFEVSYNGNVVVLEYVGTCQADLDGDGVVTAADLANLLAAWGGPGAADFNGDNVVNAADLAVLLASWGPCMN